MTSNSTPAFRAISSRQFHFLFMLLSVQKAQCIYFINAYVMSRMKVASHGKNFSARAVLSTIAGEGADSLIFFPLAFGGLMPVSELAKMMLVQVVLKTCMK